MGDNEGSHCVSGAGLVWGLMRDHDMTHTHSGDSGALVCVCVCLSVIRQLHVLDSGEQTS